MLTRAKLIDIKLTGEWLGHPSGSLLKVDERRAAQMVARGTAMIIGDENGKETAKKESSTSGSETTKEEKEIVSKMQRRDKDKMIKSSNTK